MTDSYPYDEFFNRELQSPTSIMFKGDNYAYMSVFLACVFADGEVSGNELGEYAKIVSRKEFLQGVSTHDYFQTYKSLVKEFSVYDIINEASAMLPIMLKKSLFVVCLDLVFIDTHLANKEQDFIQKLGGALHLEPDFLDMASEIINLKYL